MSSFDMALLVEVSQCLHRVNKHCERTYGLSIVQFVVLRFLIDHPAASATSMASAVGVHPSTLTQTLRRLVKKKYVFIADDPRDCRKKMISITKSGKDALDAGGASLFSHLKNISTAERELQIVRDCLLRQIRGIDSTLEDLEI